MTRRLAAVGLAVVLVVGTGCDPHALWHSGYRTLYCPPGVNEQTTFGDHCGLTRQL